MYSFEIDNILKSQNYNIDSWTYLNVCQNSPQLSHIKYNAYDDFFEMWDDQGLYWKFRVYKH
jgi:hypothetical protein